ncbi:MAG: DUF835 domain-containing protein [Methanobacteriota archaeon]
MELLRGLSYLFVGPSADTSYAAFNELLAGGARGLCLSRHNPDMIKERYGLKCPVIWLARTDRSSDNYQNVHPEHILKIHTIVTVFLRIEGESVIILDGLEYLVTSNDFTSVLKLLSLINEHIALTRARLLIPVNPSALEPKELGLLERECQRVE